MVDTRWWDEAVLQNVEGRAALHALCEIAGLDPAMPRDQWSTEPVRLLVQAHRRLLFAHVRRLRAAGHIDLHVAVAYEALAFMLLVTDTPFSRAHQRELRGAIRRDPTCDVVWRMSRMRTDSRLRQRAEALQLLLAAVLEQDPSRYVSDRPRGMRAIVRSWFANDAQVPVTRFLSTELR